MPGRRRSTNTSDDTLWILLILGIISLIGIYILTKFINENAWVRWIIFTLFSGIFIYCTQYLANALYNFYINYAISQITKSKLPVSLVGSVISIFFVKAQTDYFREWWTSGSWLVDVFNNLILVWVAILAIRLTVNIWRYRRGR